MKKILSYLLCTAIIIGLIPVSAIQVFAESNQPYSIDNGYISVQVSKKNGGFAVNTEEGDLLKKSDNNQNLLFHNDEFDTSFVSFSIEREGGSAENYIFGGTYGDNQDPSHEGVAVEQLEENGPITSTWSVGEFSFTQTISLENPGSNEHGMVAIQLLANNHSGAPVTIKTRILLDTMLGSKDYGYYQAVDSDSVTHVITTEQILNGSEYPIPQNFYASDDPYSPGIVAYSVNNPAFMPYQIAFGHWNNLASSVFDFTPNKTMDFTMAQNDFLTADSAYAMYYDLGEIPSNQSAAISGCYGVYSRQNTPAENSVAVDATIPFRLNLKPDKEDYIRLSDMGIADFSAGIVFENYDSEDAVPLSNIALSVRTTRNLRALSDTGQPLSGIDFDSVTPSTISYSNVAVGDMISKTLYFDARICENAAYECVTIGVYDVSETDGQLAEDHKLGEKITYILLPGRDGDVPKVNFASMTPDIIYYKGTRHLYVTVSNETMLADRGNWQLVACTADETHRVEIPHTMISINNGVMDVALLDEINLAKGSWKLKLEWSDSAVTSGLVPKECKIQTASALNFVVSSDIKYKNDAYSLLCVVEYTEGNMPIYRIMPFKDEAALKEFKDKKEYTEILLIFKGEFVAEKYVKPGGGDKIFTYYTATSQKSLDITSRKYTSDNTITINDCMDFEDGTMSVYYEDYDSLGSYSTSPIAVSFDGELLTSKARTSIYKGKASFTSITQGTPFSLLPYDEDGERDDSFTDSTIKLMWPSVFGVGQTIAGLLFNLAYGELGVMMNDDGEELGRVLSFSANLSLSFISKAKKKDVWNDNKFWSKFQEQWTTFKSADEKTVGGAIAKAESEAEIKRMMDEKSKEEEEENERDDKKTFSGSVMVQDILYGCGKGFVGVHFKVDIGFENFISELPGISGTLEVNTINDWSFGLEGGMELLTFSLEAKLSFKSYKNVPIPDEIYFYAGGFKPGINIDTVGVIWITGGGGGISNIYDSIFLTDALPPLRLILSVGFSIVQVLDGKATISLGLTGIDLTGEDLKFGGVVDAIEEVSLGMEWYPDLKMSAAIKVNVAEGILVGGGYIVLEGKNYTDWLFEMFARAAVKIPEDAPVVGGMTIASMDLGMSSQKMWGATNILNLDLGVTYYWGASQVDVGMGSSAKPTFPDLLGCDEDIPMGYDDERGETLYAKFGTNLSAPIKATVIDKSKDLRLMDAGLYTNDEMTLHKFNLGKYEDNKTGGLIQITYSADSREDAVEKTGLFNITDSLSGMGNNFPILIYSPDQMQDANANVTYNEDTKKATFSFTATETDLFDKDWYITTNGICTEVVYYNVYALPKLSDIEGTLSGSSLNVDWQGVEVEQLDKISFYLSKSNDPTASEDNYLIESTEDTTEIQNGSLTIDVPSDLPSGRYYLRAVYSKEDEINEVIFSDTQINFTNSDTPDACTIKDFCTAGNLEYKVTVASTNDEKTDGYIATVYDAEGNETEVKGLKFEVNESGDTIISIGGSYVFEDVSHGLTAGKTYFVGITPYNLLDTDGNGEPDTSVYGADVKTNSLVLPEVSRPQIEFISDSQITYVDHLVMADDDNNPETPAVETTVTNNTYTSDNIIIRANLSEVCTGTWSLDNAAFAESDTNTTELYKTFTSTNSLEIPLNSLENGSHTLTVTGQDEQGDRFVEQYSFDVDTIAPRLMLTAPLNGSMFAEDGTLTVTGETDSDALFTITSDGVAICTSKTVNELGGTITENGFFSFDVNIHNPNSATKHQINFTVTDSAGNSTEKNVNVTHGGLATLENVQILTDGEIINDGNIPVVLQNTEKQLTLSGVTGSNLTFVLDNERVNWMCHAVEGTAKIDENGELTLSEEAKGFVTAQFEVATGAYRTASLSFGADVGDNYVAVSSTLGGTVTGGGKYTPGDTVTLVATPDAGYKFSGWTLLGATVSDLASKTISFTMPNEGNVRATATFTADTQSNTSSGRSRSTSVVKKANELVKINLSSTATAQSYVPYYMVDGDKVFVPVSAIINNQLVFIAPVNAQYFSSDESVNFSDTDSHWAKDYIEFASARRIFKGVENNLFAPDEKMSRAMFVTALYRLAGEPQSSFEVKFKDIEEASWYETAVAWAVENGIVLGINETSFAPNELITREQMCSLIVRYLRYCKFELPKLVDNAFGDAHDISDWAAEDVMICQVLGIITGYEDKNFKPQNLATRAENCAVFERLIKEIVKKAAE